MQGEDQERLDRFLEWLEQDPQNPELLADTVDAAIGANALDQAEDLINEFGKTNPLTPNLLNLHGITLLRKGNIPESANIFEKLIDQGYDNPATGFNLAWAYALSDEPEKSLTLISDDMAEQLPQAAVLRIQMLHGLGQFDGAMDEALRLSDLHPEHPGLMAAMSVLALDLEDPELARSCAVKAGSHPDALTTLGTLELGEHHMEQARQNFAKALSLNDRNARAWVGQGLTKLNSGQRENALNDLDRGAALFGNHIGSWIAAGWAHFINQDRQASRERFQKALDLDGSFAESHGSLAVLDVVEGEIESAEKRCEIALRLDRNCFSAALAKSLVLQAQGDAAKAERIVEIAMNTPIEGSGKTLADHLVRMSGGENSVTMH